MVPFLYLVVLTLIAAGIGGQVLRFLGAECATPAERGALQVGMGLGVFAQAMLVLGLTGLLYRPIIYGVLAATALLAWSKARPHAISTLRNTTPPLAWDRLSVSVGCLLLMGVLLNMLGTLAPISSSDALSSHFAIPKIWLEDHRMSQIPFDLEAPFVLGVHMLYLMGMALHSDVLGALVHWLFGVLIVLAVFAVCQRHVPDANPWIASSIFYLSGLVAWESTSGFVDLGLTCFTVLAVHAFLNWRDGAGTRGWLIVSGVFAGLAVATKYHGGVVPVLLGLLLLIPGGKAGKTTACARRLLVFGAPVILVAVPWYVKNLIQTGDPLYPFLSALQGNVRAQTFLAWVAAASGYGKHLVDLLALPFSLTFQGEAFGGSHLLGPLYLAFLPFALCSLNSSPRAVRIIWLFMALYGLMWFFTCQQIRFLLPVVPFAAICCAQAVTFLRKLGVLVKTATTVVLLAALGFGLLVTGAYNAAFLPVVFGVESKDAFLSRTAWFYPDIRWMNNHLPQDARVLFLARAGYYLDRAYIKGSDWIAPVDLTSPTLREWLDRHRITHIYCYDASCDQLRSAKLPLVLLKENEVDLVRSRTLGGTRGRVRTAVLALP